MQRPTSVSCIFWLLESGIQSRENENGCVDRSFFRNQFARSRHHG
jgi:hypothetical protein